jgi:hypothetical protein
MSLIKIDPIKLQAYQLAEAKNARAVAYRNEADPIFFQYQRGDATEQEWLSKIEEIRTRYPYPEQ